MSTHAQGLGLRRVRSHLAKNGTLDVAFSLAQQDRHTEVVPLVPVEQGAHDAIDISMTPKNLDIANSRLFKNS